MPRSRIHNIVEHGTQPNNVSSNIKFAKELVDEMSKFKHGEILALNVLVEKLRTFDEIVALQALNMLEYCAEHSGTIFENEIGRNRFLNELAKMLSPKYDADRCPLAVKKRISLIFYEWSKLFPNQPKVHSAYLTLSNKGYIITDAIKNKKKQREVSAIEDNGAAKKLERLLHSNHPDDLVLANRLIKNMVEKEEHRTINIHNRKEKIHSIREKIQLLRDMMNSYRLGNTSVELEVIKEIKNVCSDYHADLNDTANNAIADKDPFLKDLMQLSEDLTGVLNECNEFENSCCSKKMQNLMDLDDIFGPGVSISHQQAGTVEKLELGENELKGTSTDPNTADDDFLDLFCTKSSTHPNSNSISIQGSLNSQNPNVNFSNATPSYGIGNGNFNQTNVGTTTTFDSLINSMDTLSQEKSVTNRDSLFDDRLYQHLYSKTTPNETLKEYNSLDNVQIDMSSLDIVKTVPLSGSTLLFCLALAKLKPSESCSFDNNKLKIFIFNGMNMTTNTITNIKLNVSIIKNNNECANRFKLFPISQTTLAPFNPMMPPSVFTSILVVSDLIPTVTFEITYQHSQLGSVVESIPASLEISN